LLCCLQITRKYLNTTKTECCQILYN
jgi:hypothetical protein